jgi:putative phosphoribosyl transferase
MSIQFRNRTQAGQQLAARLALYADRKDVLVLGLPRGGVPVAYQIAKLLNLPLDVFLVRKLGVPGFEELAFGAIASGGTRVLNPDIVAELKLSKNEIEQVAATAQLELERRERLFRGERPTPAIKGRTVIVVDDGLATGATMEAAVRALRSRAPAKIIVATPVAAAQAIRQLKPKVDEIVCLITPVGLYAISIWYKEFPQITEEQVRGLLAQAESAQVSGAELLAA